ncbi:acyl-CoA dehydrogenase family protein [Pullulanibacillus sp. KACC 23026]|uniref:acyl-CoA dehydrogenase family protein n=1 Tax=Pullulanibacillus sp. KACC 23026 TaxID=3028315 RepID=UPI0023B11052|nr:acyl-CoA dehydrogenase family protein [Pullulanibacillus sp. KACC 23026]WEG14863.1 acyl-CoA dehydrogenase family protein [Pullulanibacillus sp. KACC 23026]
MNDSAFQQLKSEVHDFVNGPLRELSEKIEETGQCGKDVWEELRSHGFLNLTAPESLGGKGISFSQYLEIIELFSQSHGSIRVIVHVSNGIWRPFMPIVNEEQRERFLKPLVKGDLIATFTLTEPNSGSGADIKTTVRREGNDFLINGEKWMISFGDVADYFLLFAREEGTIGYDGTLAIMIPRDTPGLKIDLMPPTMGQTGTGHAHLFLENARVPKDNLLGQPGQGLIAALSGFLDPSRISVAMTCVGLAQRALDLAVERANERVTFGKPLSKRQLIQSYIAEMATDIEAARLLCLNAGRLQDQEALVPAQASMAKFYSVEMLRRVTDKALRIFGGIGYFKGSEIERIYRDGRLQWFEEGTAETQKVVIAKHYLTKG